MKKTIIVSFVLLSTLILSCNKNQSAVKKLEGDWEEVSIGGVPVAEADKGVMHFDFCKLKKDEWCSCYYVDSNGNNTGNFDYQVKDKGDVMVQRIQDSTKGSIELQGNIKELDDSQLILEINYFGLSTTTEYKKK